MQTYGSKSQVFNKTALKTQGGLVKSDIIRIKDSSGNIRYKSKHQQKVGKKKNTFRAKWSKAVKRARTQLIKEKVFAKGTFVPIGGKSKECKALLKRVRELMK